MTIFYLCFSGVLGIMIPQPSGFASTVCFQEDAREAETKDSDGNILPTDKEAAPLPPNSRELEKATERHFEWYQVFQLLVVAMLVFWGYSLVMSGRHGQGWLVLLVIVGAITYVGRLFTSVFQEVTTNNEVRDWEDD